MPKGKFSASDVRAMVRDLRETVLSWRVANVYDLDARTYLVKLAMPGVGEKKVLLLESGVRFHLTAYEHRERTTELPSPFAMKLRKHEKSGLTRHLEARARANARMMDDYLQSASQAHLPHLERPTHCVPPRAAAASAAYLPSDGRAWPSPHALRAAPREVTSTSLRSRPGEPRHHR